MSVDKHEVKAFHNSPVSRLAYFRQSTVAPGFDQNTKSQNKSVSDSRPDTNKWLIAGYQLPTLLRDNLEELVVEPGDSYWSLAKLVVSIRSGRVATSIEVKEMVKLMAHFNGKTQCEATKINVGDVIKVPPEKPKA